MPVKVPKVERRQPTRPGGVGRIQTDVPNLARSSGVAAEEISRFADQAAKIYEKERQEAIKTKANEFGNNYAKEAQKRLYGDPNAEEGSEERIGLMHMEGDVSEKFNKFHKWLDQRKEEYVNRTDISDEAREVVRRELDQRRNGIYNQSLPAYSRKQDQYRENVYQDKFELLKQDAANSMSLLDPNDSSTLEPFEAANLQLVNSVVERNRQVGTVEQVDEDYEPGKNEVIQEFDFGDETVYYKMTHSVKQQMGEELSDMTARSVRTLIAADQTEKAKFMLNEYGDQIEPETRNDLLKDLEKDDIKNEAFKKLGELEGMSATEQRRAIRAMPSDTARKSKIKQEALAQLNSRNIHMDNLRERASRNIYNQLANQLRERTNTERAERAGVSLIDSVSMLEESTFEVDGRKVKFDNVIGKITDPKQRKALYEMVEKDRDSDPEIYNDVMDRLGNGEFRTMSYGKFRQVTQGLSEEDKDFFEGEWVDQQTDTETQRWSEMGRMNSYLTEQLQGHGLIRTEIGGNGWNKKSTELLSALRRKVSKKMKHFPEGTSIQEKTDYVDKVVSWVTRRKAQQEQEDEGFLTETGQFLGIFDESEPVEPGPFPTPQINRGGSGSWQPMDAGPRGNSLDPDFGKGNKKSKKSPTSSALQTGYEALSTAEKLEVRRRYRQAHDGENPESTEELKAWYEGRD